MNHLIASVPPFLKRGPGERERGDAYGDVARRRPEEGAVVAACFCTAPAPCERCLVSAAWEMLALRCMDPSLDTAPPAIHEERRVSTVVIDALLTLFLWLLRAVSWVYRGFPSGLPVGLLSGGVTGDLSLLAGLLPLSPPFLVDDLL